MKDNSLQNIENYKKDVYTNINNNIIIIIIIQ